MIAVVDFGSGNTRSVLRAFTAVGADARLARDPDEIVGAERLVLPGVGAAGSAARELQRRDLWKPVRDWAADGRPLLGICLGAQLLLDRSEEDETSGFGVIRGVCRAFPSTSDGGPRIVPHIGWNSVEMSSGGQADGFYVHSYWLDPDDDSTVVATTELDGFRFPSVLRAGAITATQFHPEKSGGFGRALLAAFSAGLLDWRSVVARATA